MNLERSQPPALALWLLRHFLPRRNREAITGDLLERFREGRSAYWFWRQVLVAILVGASSQLRTQWTEICFAAAGTALIWGVPWGRIFPTAAMITSMNWGARLGWLILIEATSALIALPLFAALFLLQRTFSWANLLRVSFVFSMLLIAGDMPTIWWNVNHPLISRSQATWAIPTMLAWIFATFVISARFTRRLPFPSKIAPT